MIYEIYFTEIQAKLEHTIMHCIICCITYALAAKNLHIKFQKDNEKYIYYSQQVT